MRKEIIKEKPHKILKIHLIKISQQTTYVEKLLESKDF